MLEILLIVILLPLALAVGGALLFATVFLWNYVTAVAIWIGALTIFIYGSMTNQDTFWWALGLFLVGCFFWAYSTEKDIPQKH